MKHNKHQNQLKASVSYIKDLHFTKCRACGSKNLIKFEVDTFCMDCDWDSVLMDVDCGNFEKRIAIVNRQRQQCHVHENPNNSLIEPIREIGA